MAHRGPKWAPFFLTKGWKSELLFVSLCYDRNKGYDKKKNDGSS